MDIPALRQKYEDELLNSVIPFWERHCPDEEHGGYLTFLDQDGSVYDTEKFTWMQWRIPYMFAELCRTELAQPQWLDLATQGFEFLTRHAKDEQGNYYFAVNREGVPSMAPYSIFSDCFAAMGAAALYKVSGDARHREEAISAMDHYLARMDNPKGRWEKSMQGRPDTISLGHFMMLANLGRVLGDCLDTDQYRDHIDRAAETVFERFWHPEYRVLFENVPREGGFDLDHCLGRHLNPGHGLEAMWFLLQHGEDTGNEELIRRACDAIIGLLDTGWDPAHGGIMYFMDVLGRPHLELQWDMKLWWVHNEALIATLMAYRLSGNEVLRKWFEQIDEWTWRHFPDRDYGEWFGYLNRRGEPTHALKGGKWKTFFHLPRCLLLCTQQFDAMA